MYAWKIQNFDYFKGLGFIDKFRIWINLTGINGYINKGIIVFMIAFPLYFYQNKAKLSLYLFFLIQFIIFYITSPQYRFFLPVLLVMGLLFLAEIIHQKIKVYHMLWHINLIVLLITGIWGVNFSFLSHNELMQGRPPLHSSQLIYPRSNTQFESLSFQKEQIGNLNYYSPEADSVFFYQTSDEPLPCANKTMIEYLAKEYQHIPQMRSSQLKDGFKSVKPNP